MLTIRNAVDDDLIRVVDVHMAAFPGFFLTKMGPGFLLEMYRFFHCAPGTVFLVLESGGIVAGFAVGKLNAPKTRPSEVLVFLPALALSIVRAMFKHPRLIFSKLMSILYARGEKARFPEDAMILRSIGVVPEMKGTGAARRLLLQFESSAFAKGAASVALTTDLMENDRAIRFYSSQDYRKVHEFNQGAVRPMLVMAKIINR